MTKILESSWRFGKIRNHNKTNSEQGNKVPKNLGMRQILDYLGENNAKKSKKESKHKE